MSTSSNTTVKTLPVHLNLFAGALSGICELLVMYPLDVIKTRAQQVGAPNISIPGSLLQLVKEGGIPRLYRGILPPLMIEPIKRAVKFTANDEYSKLIVPKGQKKTDLQASMAGALTGMTESCVIAPFEVVKVRLQVVNRLSQYNNTFDCAKKIFQNEGPMAFTIGLSSAMQRNAVWNSIYFAMIGFINSKMTHRTPKNNFEKMMNNFLIGVVAGVLATSCNTPWDVVCSRVRNNPLVYKYTLPSMYRIVSTEGVTALWRGYTAKVMRLGPGGGIMLVSYEAFKQILLRYVE